MTDGKEWGDVKNVWGPDGGGVIGRPVGPSVTYGFPRTPRSGSASQEEATGDNVSVNPHHRNGSALAHDTAGTSGPGTPGRSVGRSSHTPRDGRRGDRPGRPGTPPPVPGRLTFLFATGALGAVLFALLTWQVTSHGPLIGRDLRVLRWFQRTAAAHPRWDTPAHYVCKLGNVEVAVPVLLAAIVLAAVLGRWARLVRWWLPPLAAAVAMAAVPVIVSLVKAAVVRPAPGRIHPRSDGYGYFPSGHTATSAMAYGLSALLVVPFVRWAAVRAVLVIATVLLLGAVGAALVWCDYHWPVDVLGSWCLTATLMSCVAAASSFSGRVARGPVSRSSGSPD